MRPNSPKATIVIGVNQGEFPSQLSENGLFSEVERDRLLESGIQLNPSVIKLDSYEKYYLYSALCTPSHHLVVTSHTAKLTGEDVYKRQPKTREVELGRAEVREVFKITGVGTVAGCYVLEGKITRNAEIRIVRDGIIIADEHLTSLKRFKDDVKEVARGYELSLIHISSGMSLAD